MKKITVAFALTMLFSGYAQAHGHHRHACRAVWIACSEAGIEGKDNVRACVHTIRQGGAVEGVNVDEADLQKCRAPREPSS